MQSADCNVIRDEMPEVLHPMLRSSDALTIFDLCLLPNWGANKLLTDDADETSKMKPMCCIWCRCHQMQWRLSDFRKIESSTIVCWRRRGVWCLLKLQTDWLTAKQAVDWWMTQIRRQMLAFIDCERFFSFTDGFFFVFSDVFRAVNVVFRWFDYFSCRAKWIWLVCDDTLTFDRSSESMIFRINAL